MKTELELGQEVWIITEVDVTCNSDDTTCPACGGARNLVALDQSLQPCAKCDGEGCLPRMLRQVVGPLKPVHVAMQGSLTDEGEVTLREVYDLETFDEYGHRWNRLPVADIYLTEAAAHGAFDEPSCVKGGAE